MLNVYCVWVKPKYHWDDVVRLYSLCVEYLSVPFNFFCLTDQPWFLYDQITIIDVREYQLDSWWNKVLIFDNKISGEDKNLYLDLDVDITADITELLDDIDQDHLHVVDTPWKDEKYFNQKYSSYSILKRADSYFSYGNSSVMGWIGNSHSYLTKMLLNDVFKHTLEHYGDDTFINKYGKIKYFKPLIATANNPKLINNPKIIIHHKLPSYHIK